MRDSRCPTPPWWSASQICSGGGASPAPVVSVASATAVAAAVAAAAFSYGAIRFWLKAPCTTMPAAFGEWQVRCCSAKGNGHTAQLDKLLSPDVWHCTTLPTQVDCRLPDRGYCLTVMDCLKPFMKDDWCCLLPPTPATAAPAAAPAAAPTAAAVPVHSAALGLSACTCSGGAAGQQKGWSPTQQHCSITSLGGPQQLASTWLMNDKSNDLT